MNKSKNSGFKYLLILGLTAAWCGAAAAQPPADAAGRGNSRLDDFTKQLPSFQMGKKPWRDVFEWPAEHRLARQRGQYRVSDRLV